jgi:hypothetical protein
VPLILLCADSGIPRLFQKLADETGFSISVCNFPPGTSKWNKVEHRLFSFISSNWRGEPLRDYGTIVNLISRTTTAKGLQTSRVDYTAMSAMRICCVLERNVISYLA